MSQPNNQFFSDRSNELIKKFMIGGALLGGGTMLATDLVNWLGHLKKNKEEDDDDTLYVYKDKEQVKAAGVGTGVALAAGLGSAVGSGLLVHKLYKKFRRAEAQKELDDAQNVFVETQGYKKVDKKKKKDKDGETEKSASSIGLGEAVMSAPFALPLILALGAGVTSYGMLDNAYPVKKPKVKGPRRIEIVEKPAPEAKPEVTKVEVPSEKPEEGDAPTVEKIDNEQSEYGAEKAAAYGEDDGREFLIRMVHMNCGSNSATADLVGAVAGGQGDSFCKAASAVGFINALDTIKGGKFYEAGPVREHMAISYLAKKASIKNQVGLVAAAEFADRFPTFYKMASALPEDKKYALSKIACILGSAIRAELSFDLGIVDDEFAKSASLVNTAAKMAVGNEVVDVLGDALADKARESLTSDAVEDTGDYEVDSDEEVATDGSKSESSDTSGEHAAESNAGTASKKDPVKIIASSKTARRMMDRVDPDDIDKMLNP